jgi:chromosome segregation ATPase
VSDLESNEFLLQQLSRQRASLFEAVGSYERQVQGLEERIHELTDAAEVARSRVIELEFEAQVARAANEELDWAAEELRCAMGALLASRSWRMTRSFRRITGVVRRWLRS